MTAHRPSKFAAWAWTTVGVAVVSLTVLVAWNDHASARGQTVALNISFLDTDVSGKSLEEVRDIVTTRADEVLSADVIVDVGEDDLVFGAGELGFTYDVEAVVSDIMDARHTGGLDQRLYDWVSSPLEPQVYGDRFGYDPAVASARLHGDPGLVLAEPVEPVITMEGGDHLYVVAGIEGGIVDVEDLVNRLGDKDPTSGEIRIDARRSGLPPTVADGEAQEVVDSINDITEDGIDFLIGSTHAHVGSWLLRRRVDVVASDHNITVRFDAEGLHSLLEGLASEPVTDLIAPTFAIENDRPVVVDPGEVPLVCCDRESVWKAAELIMADADGPIRLQPRPAEDPTLVAWASGELVTEKVGEFTTRHACCQSRVNNIHRIADIVRGLYLVPGESVSLNEYVGQRTREKGFVPAGAIRAGHLESEVGGGVSQFATTIFNAAFFAGLDIPDYQAHSLYFSRYPFGREATISHPAPDLVLHNTTEHPVLIWTSYTDTSITVSMYSTEHVDVEQIAQRVGSWNRCTYVETDRQRTYPDGRVIVDTFEALYRPADGIDCNGNAIPRT